MLIKTATIGYGRQPEFEVYSPNAPTMEQRMAWALLNRKVFWEACEKEGIDLSLARKIAGVKDVVPPRGRRTRAKL